MKREETEDLLKRCIDGEPEAWETFVDRFLPYFARIVRSQLRSIPDPASRDAILQDILQDCFLVLWKEDRRILRQYDGRAPLHSFLRVVVLHRALKTIASHRRFERSRQPDFRLWDGFRPVREDEDPLEREEHLRQLYCALERLSSTERLLLEWIRGEGMPYEEAARLLDLSSNSIGPLVQRAENRLKRLLSS